MGNDVRTDHQSSRLCSKNDIISLSSSAASQTFTPLVTGPHLVGRHGEQR